MAHLSVDQLSTLMSILDKENVENQTLEYLVFQLHTFFKPEDNFKVGYSLLTLILHSDILFNQTQIFAAIILCYELYQNEPMATNPLAQLFMHLLHKTDVKNVYVEDLPDLTMPAKKFLSNLIMSQNSTELLQMTAKQVLTAHSDPFMPIVDTATIFNTINDLKKNLPTTAKSSLPVTIPDPQKTETKDDAKQVLEMLICGPKSYASRNIKPEMMRLVPPLYTCENELVLFVQSNRSNIQIMYDKTMCVYTSFDTKAHKLMTKALEEPLTLRQQQHLLTEIENDSKLVYKIGLTPCKLPDLVERNPLIAIEVLLKLMRSHNITDYFFELVNMELSLHSMEVVNRLTVMVELPSEFVHLYITNCITACETIKDHYMQNRLVRLVCVFLQSIIRNKIINEQELFTEVQAFCIDFIQIREASALFRLLKQPDFGDMYSFGNTAAASASIKPSTINDAINKDK